MMLCVMSLHNRADLVDSDSCRSVINNENLPPSKRTILDIASSTDASIIAMVQCIRSHRAKASRLSFILAFSS